MTLDRAPLAALLVAALSCGVDSPSTNVQLDVSFPAESNGVIPFSPGGPFDVDVRATLAGLCSSTRATVEIVSASAPPGAVVSATPVLVPLDGCALGGRAKLTWPPGGGVTVRATAAGKAVEKTTTLGASAPVTLAVTATPATLPPAGSVVVITVTATLSGAPARGVPIAIEVLPTTTQVTPAQLSTAVDGSAETHALVPPDVSQIRVDAVSGNVRSGVTISR